MYPLENMDEILCEGFLTKSPPERKINRARWHQRWFVLRRLRGTYILQYFKDRNSVTPKGTISLSNCEQVDQGLTFESKKFHDDAHIFDIVTPKRKYFLVARSEEDMIRWVRNICEVCGFHLDGSDINDEDVGVQTQPMTIHHQQEEPEPRYTDEPIRSPPTHSNGTLDEGGYFDLSDSVTGEGTTPTNGARHLVKGLPVSVHERDSGVAALDDPIDRHLSFESSDGSAPSDSAPLPPPKTPIAKTSNSTLEEDGNDIYDTPPVHHRHSIASDSGAIYDCPPSLLRRPSQPIEMESIYKTVPPPRPSTSSSLDYPMPMMSPLKNGSVFEHADIDEMASDIYDVPPAMHELPSTRQVYDTPPVGYLKNDELSQSTDNLAKTFQNISFRNSMGTSSVTSDNVDLYDIPSPSSNSLNDSGHFASSSDHGPVSPPMDMAPPRPPKPVHLKTLQDPTTPPPSFDDTYNIPLNLQPQTQMNAADLQNRLSQEIQGQTTTSEAYATPPAWSGHTWMDNKGAVRYINTKRTEPKTPIARNSLDGTIPAPDPNSYVNVRNERYTFAPKASDDMQSCYLPMQGSSGNSTSFEFCEETYMAMEGATDGTADSYTFMQSPSPFSGPPPIVPRSKSVSSRNSQGELPPPIPRSLSQSSRNSLGERPPPVDRNKKPDRRSATGSISHTPDLAAVMGVGSYYATPDDTFDVGSIIPSERTQSFSKPGRLAGGSQKPESLLQESFRRRTNTGESTTSSSGESGVGGQEAHYVTPTDGRRQPTVAADVYVMTEAPQLTPKLEKEQAASIQQSQAAQPPKENPTFESIADANIPPPIVEEVDSAKIEYLELDHTKNEESPPPRPPKPVSSTSVEYFDLDPQKTKALRDVTVERQKESYNKAT